MSMFISVDLGQQIVNLAEILLSEDMNVVVFILHGYFIKATDLLWF